MHGVEHNLVQQSLATVLPYGMSGGMRLPATSHSLGYWHARIMRSVQAVSSASFSAVLAL